MITKEQARIGTMVVSNVDFSGVPKGTRGMIDQDYGMGIMVAWDLPNWPLPEVYKRWNGKYGALRDGFSWPELQYLDLSYEKFQKPEPETSKYSLE